ncbi:MAG: histidine decarboxylase [Crocinitomicaceae bacterium]|nr:histidine decarboxylase [Crocinitomicaceae bacterium]
MRINENAESTLNKLLDDIRKNSDKMLGYPLNKKFDYSALYPFLSYTINNAGDPYELSSLGTNTMAIERSVLNFFADLFNAPEGNWWGYVNHGGSEGNLYGLYLARECYPKGIVYYCESAHYSAQKNIRLLNLPSVVIKAQANGEIDYDDLNEAVRVNRHLPVIIFATAGTTMTEARDDVDTIQAILKELRITNKYIHVDAALSGMIYPFLESRPRFAFETGIDSISVSGHKFLGSPLPCGVVISKKSNRDRIAEKIPYIDSVDATIAGSRNGITPLILWYAIQSLKEEGAHEYVQKCIEVAKYAEQKLKEIGIPAWRNPNAITVVLPTPPRKICKTWQLAVQNDIAHLITMPDVNKEKIDAFVIDLEKELIPVEC